MLADQAAEILRGGGLVIYPTDTVYGLGADPTRPGSIERIYRVKGRPDEKAIIWLIDSLDRARMWCEVDERAERLANAYWPGGLTLVLRLREPSAGGLPTLGVRVPNHEAALAVISAAGGVVATTSANRSGEPSPRTAEDAEAQIGRDVNLIIDAGPCTVGTESTVLDLSEALPRVLRSGAVPFTDIEHVLNG